MRNRFTFTKTNTFCISLLSNKERCARMNERCAKMNMDVTIWPASTKDTLTENFAHYLNDGQRGCAQSHYNIWKHILQNNIAYALVLEDDACLDKKFTEKCNQFSHDDDEWDCLFLNASESLPTELHNTWSLANEQYLTGGYIISIKGARNLVNMFSSCLYGADWMTTRIQKYNNCYTYFPWIIIQEGTETTVGSNLEADHAKVLRLLGEANYSLDNYLI